MISIPEELFLLALDEEKGNFLSLTKKTLSHALSGGILAELTLSGKVCSDQKHRLELLNDAVTGDEVLDKALSEIGSSEKLRKLTYWVSELSARPKKLREEIGDSLVAKGLLLREEKRYFRQNVSSEETAQTIPSKFELKTPLRALVLSSDEFNARDFALLNVVAASGLLDLIFTRDELKIAEQHIHEKVLRSALQNPIMETIEEIEKAIVTSLEDDSD